MAINKVVYAGRTLIDLTSDTITASTLLKGQVAHGKDGSVITGTLFANHPDQYEVFDTLEDSSGRPIFDSQKRSIIGRTVYRKA